MTKQEAINTIKKNIECNTGLCDVEKACVECEYYVNDKQVTEALSVATTCIKKCIEIEMAVGTEIEHILFISNEAGADN